jgi:hypothetical protein
MYVKPGVVWSRGGKEICVLGLDGRVSFYAVTVSHSPNCLV